MNNDFEYKDLNTKQLCVDTLYQRSIDLARVNRIVNDWCDLLVNPIKVSYRDGKYFVFDGQHTVAAFKAKNKGKDCIVPCKVFYGLTWYDEADLFLKQTGDSRKVDMTAKFRTMFNMGHPDVVRMVTMAEKSGVKIDFKKAKGYYTIICLSTLFSCSKQLSDTEYAELFYIIGAAWDGHPDAYSSEIIKGLTKFITTYRGVYKRSALVSSLQKTTPRQIINEGKTSIAPGDAKYARQILSAYNRNRTSNRLQDKL